MKINARRNADFIPVEIVLTLDNKTELDAFATLFCTPAVVQALGNFTKMTCTEIANHLKTLGANTDATEDFSRALVKTSALQSHIVAHRSGQK